MHRKKFSLNPDIKHGEATDKHLNRSMNTITELPKRKHLYRSRNTVNTAKETTN